MVSLNTSVSSIAAFYTQNQQSLGQTLLRLSTGKRFNSSYDDAVGMIRSQSFKLQSASYSNIAENLGEWDSAMSIAGTAGDQVKSGVSRLQELVYLAGQGPTASELAGYQSEYNQTVLSLESIVKNTQYQGNSLMNTAATITSIPLSPGSATNVLAIAPGVAITTATFTALKADNLSTALATAQTNVTAATTAIDTYNSKIHSFQWSIGAQKNLASSIVSNMNSADSVLSNIDDAQEMITYTNQQIRSETSMAMLAQANMASKGILTLYGLMNR